MVDMARLFTRLFACVVALVCVAGVLRAGAANVPPIVGTDVSYAPLEFYAAGDKTPRGFDVDLTAAIVARMGGTLDMRNHSFDTILPGVSAGTIDLGVSSISDTPAREKTVDFVDYLMVGTGMLVPRGNPHHVFNLGGLCGLRVDVQKGTSTETLLQTQSKTCRALGLGAVRIEDYATDQLASNAFAAGASDVHLSDYPVVAYLAQTSKGKFVIGGRQFNDVPYGIAVAKSRPALRDAVRNALAAVVASGAYDDLLKKWNLQQAAMRSAPVNAGRLFSN